MQLQALPASGDSAVMEVTLYDQAETPDFLVLQSRFMSATDGVRYSLSPAGSLHAPNTILICCVACDCSCMCGDAANRLTCCSSQRFKESRCVSMWYPREAKRYFASVLHNKFPPPVRPFVYSSKLGKGAQSSTRVMFYVRFWLTSAQHGTA